MARRPRRSRWPESGPGDPDRANALIAALLPLIGLFLECYERCSRVLSVYHDGRYHVYLMTGWGVHMAMIGCPPVWESIDQWEAETGKQQRVAPEGLLPFKAASIPSAAGSRPSSRRAYGRIKQRLPSLRQRTLSRYRQLSPLAATASTVWGYLGIRFDSIHTRVWELREGQVEYLVHAGFLDFTPSGNLAEAWVAVPVTREDPLS